MRFLLRLKLTNSIESVIIILRSRQEPAVAAAEFVPLAPSCHLEQFIHSEFKLEFDTLLLASPEAIIAEVVCLISDRPTRTTRRT